MALSDIISSFAAVATAAAAWAQFAMWREAKRGNDYERKPLLVPNLVVLQNDPNTTNRILEFEDKEFGRIGGTWAKYADVTQQQLVSVPNHKLWLDLRNLSRMYVKRVKLQFDLSVDGRPHDPIAKKTDPEFSLKAYRIEVELNLRSEELIMMPLLDCRKLFGLNVKVTLVEVVDQFEVKYTGKDVQHFSAHCVFKNSELIAVKSNTTEKS